jgi:hypothetical protein
VYPITSTERKSVRRIADAVSAPDAVQSLQQFVNQSPWDSAPVRAQIARYADERLNTRAWLVRNVYVPKRGGHSVGVARRYVPSAGRIVNCQQGLGLFLSNGYASVPVDWRLVLPESWQSDRRRRERAGVPDIELAYREWEHILSLVDEAVGKWGMPPRPLVVNMRHTSDVDRLVAGLNDRQVPFVIQVSGSVPGIPVGRLAAAPTDGPGEPAELSSVREIAQAARSRRTAPVVWWDMHTGLPRRVQMTSVPIRLPVAVNGERGMVLSLAQIAAQRQVDVDELERDYGLLDFEGRSFRGWHHHITMVSAALAFAKLSGDQAETVELAEEMAR